MKPNLVLLPGMLCDRAFYEPQMPELQKVASVTIAAYPDTRTIAAMADLVLRDAPEHFAVVGHSMGGRIAQEIVARVPQRVTGLALLATDYRGIRTAEERSAEEARRQEMLDQVDREGFTRFAQQWAPRLVAPDRRTDQSLIARIAGMAERFGRAGLDAHWRAGLSRVDYGELLPTVAVPTLVMTGSEDEVRPPGLHRDIAGRIPQARLAIIEGSGHMLSMEDPDAVTAHMIPWIAALKR